MESRKHAGPPAALGDEAAVLARLHGALADALAAILDSGPFRGAPRPLREAMAELCVGYGAGAQLVLDFGRGPEHWPASRAVNVPKIFAEIALAEQAFVAAMAQLRSLYAVRTLSARAAEQRS